MINISKSDYTSRQHVAYSFEANWELTGQIVRWDARIWRDGQVVGTQAGAFRDSPSRDVSALVAERVKANLEAGIENCHVIPGQLNS